MSHISKWCKSAALLLLCLYFCIPVVSAQKNAAVTIKAKVHDRDSDVIYLIPRTESLRSEKKISISVKNNQFEYSFTPEHIEAYELVFEDEYSNGVWVPVTFFPDTSIIYMDLYPQDEHTKNTIRGGSYNTAYYRFKALTDESFKAAETAAAQKLNQLSREEKLNSKEYYEVLYGLRNRKENESPQPYYEKMDILRKTGMHLSDTGQIAQQAYDSIYREKLRWKYAAMQQSPHPSYFYILYEDLIYRSERFPEMLPEFEAITQVYSDLYPGSIYSQKAVEKVNGMKNIYPGKYYIDVTAAQLNGDSIQLSSLMTSQLTLLNLWGSWCGPCIDKTRKILPLYEQYRSKGFNIIGIAREFGNTNALLSRIKNDNFNFTHLIELNDQFGIWSKYGVQNAAGIMVLVDREGKILAVNPTLEEIENTLKRLL